MKKHKTERQNSKTPIKSHLMMNLISLCTHFQYIQYIHYTFYGNCNVFNFRLDLFSSQSIHCCSSVSINAFPLFVINYGTVLTLATRLNSIELVLLMLLLLLFCFKLTIEIRYVQLINEREDQLPPTSSSQLSTSRSIYISVFFILMIEIAYNFRDNIQVTFDKTS